ncbi:MAG: hypothetical protein CM1200mP36_06750 [Gammaproteobacteria bacterium]|nr:MAG: hypothetical protein CM1200mP36_06750 [Gammaproteobacteria bacterium]
MNFFLTASAKANRSAAIAGTVEVNERAFRGFDETDREAAMNLMEDLRTICAMLAPSPVAWAFCAN